MRRGVPKLRPRDDAGFSAGGEVVCPLRRHLRRLRGGVRQVQQGDVSRVRRSVPPLRAGMSQSLDGEGGLKDSAAIGLWTTGPVPT